MKSYTFHITLFDFAFLVVIIVGINFSLLLWFSKRTYYSANKYLALALMISVLWITHILAIDIGLADIFPIWTYTPLQFSLALGPLIYFYILKLTRPEYKLRFKDLLHFSPLLLELSVQLLFQPLNPVIPVLAFISVITYLYFSHRLIERFYQGLRFNEMSDRYRYQLRWLHRLLTILGLLWLLWIPLTAVHYYYQFGIIVYYPLYLLLIGAIIWIAVVAHLRPEAMMKAEALVSKPSLTADLKQKRIWLKRIVKENHYYQDPELSLTSLADKLGLTTHELSRIINTALKKSFNDFINEYRVVDVVRKMQDPAYDHLTLVGIAFESGFNSKSTFNRIFRQMTGKSAAEYKIYLKKERPSYNLSHLSRIMPVILNRETALKWSDDELTRNFMFKNYFKTAFRHFWRHKLSTFINVIGLSIGISASVVIYLIVHYDFTFDKFHQDSDRIYRIVLDETFGDSKNHSSGIEAPLTEAVRSQATGIQEITPLFELSPNFVYIDKSKSEQKRFKEEDRIILTDQQYFKIFSYMWLAGSSQHALDEPNQVVLTSEQAKIYFPSLSYQDMIGKIVTYDTIKTTVSGIVQTLTENTDFAFHDFISFSTAADNKLLAASLRLTGWNHIFSGSEVVLKLTPGASVTEVEKQINAVAVKNKPPRVKQDGPVATWNYRLQRLDDIHFNTDYNIFDFSIPANKSTLYGLLVIAGFLLLLGCINFVNLTTAQGTQRAKEIGIRKTMGGNRIQLVVQFLSETFFVTLFAVIISALLAPVILKIFADFVSPNIHANVLRQPGILLFLLILTIAVTLLSGFYPAIMLSGYKPVSVLKNQVQNNSGKTRNAWLRKSLTVSQFVVAQFFIMATILVSKQVYYALHKDLGFKKDAILIVNSPWNTSKASSNKWLMNKFRAMPQVALVSMGDDPPSSDVFNRTQGVYNDGKKQITTGEVIFKTGDENYLKLYQVKLLAGRNIQESDTGKAVIINNTYAKILGFANPHDAIGKQMARLSGARNLSIIGVVSDFNERSLHSPIYPAVICWGRPIYREMATLHVSLKPETRDGNEWKTTIANMGKAWKQVYPDDEFDYHFYDEVIARFYDEEQHTSTLLTCATGLSILVSCLGLLGLAIYTTNQRTKEIGVRKVFGASVTQIVTLLSTELVLLILLAFVIVTPIAWYCMNKWMETFTDRTTISWWIFAISGAGMLLTGLITLSFQTFKAAVVNPVKSLRSE